MIRVVPIPRDAALQRRSQPDSCARLDSSPTPSPWSRWSYQPGPARLILQCDGRTQLTTLQDATHEIRRWDDPLAALWWLGQANPTLPRSTKREGVEPPFKGGWIGYLSYDLGRLFERLPVIATDDLNLPLFTFTYHDRVTAWDAVDHHAYECRVEPELASPALQFAPRYGRAAGPPVSNFGTRQAYEAAVARAIEYIAAGDIFQVNLAQRFTAGLPAEPAAIYQTLCQRFPAWFGAYLDYGEHALICNSPELFLRVTPDGHVITRPIKGTRARQPGMDGALKQSLKDEAELNMIIDLERNDLGRVCAIGSVRVTEPRTIEAHPTVYHGVATVEGHLRPGVGLVDLLRATFPGGSITGAPKIRATEIIEELEPTRRGPYCGAIGFLSVDGHVELNVAIRTMIAIGDRVHIPVGGGIVADSVPSAEYDETLVKARAMFAALGESQ